MHLIFATQIGAQALYLFIVWLASAYGASLLSARKGYGEKPGLATGLLLSFVAPVIWLLIPARAGSRWKTNGPFERRRPAREDDPGT
jgi:hypothetical protein